MKQKNRLDKLLVEFGYVDNVNKAKALIMSGKVLVNEKKVEKPGTKFQANVAIRLIKILNKSSEQNLLELKRSECI